MSKKAQLNASLVYRYLLLTVILGTFAFACAQDKNHVKTGGPSKLAPSIDATQITIKKPATKTVAAKESQKVSITVPIEAPISFSDGAIVIQPPAPDPYWVKLIPILSGLLGALIGGGMSLIVAGRAYKNALRIADKQTADKHTTDFYNGRIAALNKLLGEIYECQGVALRLDYCERQLLNYRMSNQPITDLDGKLIGTTIKAEVVLDAEKERDKWNAEFYSKTARAISSAEEYGRIPAEVMQNQPHWGDWLLKFRQDLLSQVGKDMIAIAGLANQIAFKTRDLREYEEHLLACHVAKLQPDPFERPATATLGARTLSDRDVSVAELDQRVAYYPSTPRVYAPENPK